MRRPRPPPIIIPETRLGGMEDVMSPLSSASSASSAFYGERRPVSASGMSPSFHGVEVPVLAGDLSPPEFCQSPVTHISIGEMGDVASLMSSTQTEGWRGPLGRRRVSSTACSNTSAEAEDAFSLQVPAVKVEVLDALGENLAALQKLLHDGEGNGDSRIVGTEALRQ